MTLVFTKVLIANRGEIAVRIVRACRDLGISPVAIYSEADRTSLHVSLADEAYLVGPPAPSESYLAIDRIIEIARRCKAQAVHPGYGFLSENPRFAAACAEAGIPMIGPSAASIRLMGNKTEARATMLRSGIPTVPGTFSPVESVSYALQEARRIGYPVMIKAAAGGGGKGMRLVRQESRLPGDFEAARSEALRAFGDPSVYLEKFIQRPRHIEVQILADRHGNAVYLGERECSLQRRHQKLLEECPSPVVDDGMRRRMGEVALKVARAAAYENAGTVEFLVDEERNFYFLEMNTRIQVEHPVTELVTGIDLVQEQFRIALGHPLSRTQEEITMRGWAAECRIYAEDPANSFFPSPGTIRQLVEPQGPGVRVDSGVYEGWEVPVHYDPLIAKLVTYGADRTEAMARMRRAVREYLIRGVKTNLEFFTDLLEDPEFMAGRFSTEFVESFVERRKARHHKDPPAALLAAAAALAHGESAATGGTVGSMTQTTWRKTGRQGLLPCPVTRRSWKGR